MESRFVVVWVLVRPSGFPLSNQSGIGIGWHEGLLNTFLQTFTLALKSVSLLPHRHGTVKVIRKLGLNPFTVFVYPEIRPGLNARAIGEV